MNRSSARHPGQIVVGVDGSNGAMRAIAWAAEEAARHGVPLRMVHAYYQPLLYYPPFATATTANSMLLARARRRLRLAVVAARKARPDVTVHAELEYGQPIGVLLDESTAARMIVLGAHRRRFETLRLSSTAVAVAAHGHCPVAVIPDGLGAVPGLPVVVGVDGSPLSEAAISLAFDEASTRRVGLVAVHAWSEVPEQGVITLTDTPQDLRRREGDEERLLAARLAGWQEKYPDVSVERVVTQQRPQAALLEYAGAAQLVVVGSHGRGGVTGLLLGSTSQALLHRSPCPVIVAKPTRS